MKSSAAFRMWKSTKRVLATIVDPHARGAYKRAMIEAQLAAEAASKSSKTKQRTGTTTEG